MYCQNCGNQNNDNNKYCWNCGRLLVPVDNGLKSEKKKFHIIILLTSIIVVLIIVLLFVQRISRGNYSSDIAEEDHNKSYQGGNMPVNDKSDRQTELRMKEEEDNTDETQINNQNASEKNDEYSKALDYEKVYYNAFEDAHKRHKAAVAEIRARDPSVSEDEIPMYSSIYYQYCDITGDTVKELIFTQIYDKHGVEHWVYGLDKLEEPYLMGSFQGDTVDAIAAGYKEGLLFMSEYKSRYSLFYQEWNGDRFEFHELYSGNIDYFNEDNGYPTESLTFEELSDYYDTDRITDFPTEIVEFTEDWTPEANADSYETENITDTPDIPGIEYLITDANIIYKKRYGYSNLQEGSITVETMSSEEKQCALSRYLDTADDKRIENGFGTDGIYKRVLISDIPIIMQDYIGQADQSAIKDYIEFCYEYNWGYEESGYFYFDSTGAYGDAGNYYFGDAFEVKKDGDRLRISGVAMTWDLETDYWKAAMIYNIFLSIHDDNSKEYVYGRYSLDEIEVVDSVNGL